MGAGNPSLTNAIIAMADDFYSDIAQPYTDTANITLMSAETARRFGPLVQRDAQAYGCWGGSLGTLGPLGLAQDDPHLSVIGLQNCPSPGYITCAVLAAVSAYYLAIDPARPLNTLALPGVIAPAPADRFPWAARNTLLQDGIGTVSIGTDNVVRIERLVTTYKVNPAGAPDTSYLQTETMALIGYLRFSWRTRMLTKFTRCKIANDTGQPPAPGVVTPSIIAQEQIAWFVEMENLGYVYDVAEFKANQVVVRNSLDPTRVDTLLPPRLVAGLQVIAAKLRFLF